MSKGGSFLWPGENTEEAFIPEAFSDEQRMIAAMTADFVNNEIVPLSHDIEEMKPGLMPELLRKTGELGLLSADVPEEWGGMGLGLISSMLITENVSPGGSFAVALTDHTGFGTLPIVLFGNKEQKARYLPGLSTGEKLGAYALTEAGSGSDALAAKTKAISSEDGKYYLLNGTKQFITNAGIADVIVTFAKVDGDKFTAFVVEKDSQGLSLGAEEKKTGISGSSTRSVIYEDAKVPVENVLFEIGKGHVVAFNILNLGRLRLGAHCVGTAKAALKHAAKYALEREQFGQPIARFGMIQDKLARMATVIYIAESMLYRTAGQIDQALAGCGQDVSERAENIEEYAIECSINKIFASEALDLVADETVQIFGGYGYVREYPADQIYRDSRINRIFAGTNEINRLLIANTILRRSLKGQLPVIPQTLDVSQDNIPGFQPGNDLTIREEQVLAASKKALLFVAGTAIQRHKDSFDSQQEILGLIADLVIQVYAMESGLLRTIKVIESEGAENADPKLDLLRSYYNDAVPRIQWLCTEALAALTNAEELCDKLKALDKLIGFIPVNAIAARRRISARVQEACGYTVN